MTPQIQEELYDVADSRSTWQSKSELTAREEIEIDFGIWYAQWIVGKFLDDNERWQ